MKKKLLVIGLVLLILVVLFCPFFYDVYQDGGTTDLRALTYRVVKWKKIDDEELSGTTTVFFFPENFNGYEDLYRIALERQSGK